jgi:RNA polymerase-associated protein LEO1
LNIEPKPFDDHAFRESLQLEGDDLRLALESTIRWRHGKNPESNARLIRWSDNTFSLLIGEEMFEVGTTDIQERNQFLTTQHPRDQFLKTQTRFQQFMSFTPSSTSSLAHKKFMLQLAQRHQKVSKAKQYVMMEDPEKQARELEKVEMEKWRAKKKLEAKQKNAMRSVLDDEDRYIRGNRALLREMDQYDEEEGI